jgi:hypothetical protein
VQEIPDARIETQRRFRLHGEAHQSPLAQRRVRHRELRHLVGRRAQLVDDHAERHPGVALRQQAQERSAAHRQVAEHHQPFDSLFHAHLALSGT